MIDTESNHSVLLIDMGGPQSLSEVQRYLRRIFSDPYIIPGNAVKRWLLSRLIARRSAARTRARYASIGGKSRAVAVARTLATELTKDFADRGVRIECAVATRYSLPNIQQGLKALSRCNRDRVTPVYLFPHETTALTGSCEDVLLRVATRFGIPVELGVRHLGMSDAYVKGWAEAIKQAVQRPAESFVILSAHSLPMSIVNRGDPYVTEVEQSARRIQALIGDIACGLAYQSQEGDNWLGPSVEEKATEASHGGYRDLIVAPLSFVGDNTETLIDLDQDLRRAIKPLGFHRFVRIKTPDKRGFLCKMVAEALRKEWGLDR